MLEIIAATNNANKLREIREIFFEAKILSLRDVGISCDPEESGKTFEENALIKARAVYSLIHLSVISDDSGLSVDALNGEPGIHSARYAGIHGDDDANNNKLLNQLSLIEDRRAEFLSAVAFICDKGEFVALGKTEGEILTEKVGNGGFGYDPLFYSYDLKKSFGESSAAEKNSVSHRARALSNLKCLLEKNHIL